MLVELASVIDAVRGAVEVQQAMPARTAEIPEERRISQFSAATLVSGIRVHTKAVAISPTAARLRKAAPTPK